jgi:hypothetical protein
MIKEWSFFETHAEFDVRAHCSSNVSFPLKSNILEGACLVHGAGRRRLVVCVCVCVDRWMLHEWVCGRALSPRWVVSPQWMRLVKSLRNPVRKGVWEAAQLEARLNRRFGLPLRCF